MYPEISPSISSSKDSSTAQVVGDSATQASNLSLHLYSPLQPPLPLESLEYGPYQDFYNMFSFSVLLLATLITVGQICIWTLINLAAGGFNPLDTFVLYAPYSLFMSFACCVLLSLILSKLQSRSQRKSNILSVISFIAYMVMLQIGVLTGFTGAFFGIDTWVRVGYLLLYVGLSCWQAYKLRRRNKNSQGLWQDE